MRNKYLQYRFVILLTIFSLSVLSLVQGVNAKLQEIPVTKEKDDIEVTSNAFNFEDEHKLSIDYQQLLQKVNSTTNNSNHNLRAANFSFTNAKGRHSCERRCQGNQPLTCYYRLVVHPYQAMSAECERCSTNEGDCQTKRQCIYGDGVQTPIMAVNQQLPAPPIEVCIEDNIVVDVINYWTEPISIHWHGLAQFRTPEMDGAPYITQYPIQPAEAYRYQFKAERAGSLWYNSHVGLQRSMGIGGSFVIRQPVLSDRQSYLYDFDLPEHTLVIQDYVYGNDLNRLRNLLINGKGRNHLTNLSDRDPRHRYERIQVTHGKRYRVRVIYNGVFNCPIEFSVENHRMLMISTDGNDIVPILADSFFMASGERFDFVLQADQQARSYWIKVRGYEKCATENIYQGAILTYQSSRSRAIPQEALTKTSFCELNFDEYFVVGDFDPKRQKTMSFAKNGCARSNFKVTDVATVGLTALAQVPWTRDTEFFTHYTLFGSRASVDTGSDMSYKIDDITFMMSKIPLLQTNGLFNEIGVFCNNSLLMARGQNCATRNCVCTNVVRLLSYRAIELVLVNNNNEPIPVHLHGYVFRLVGQNVLGGMVDIKQIKNLDKRGLLQRSTDDFPIEKDTVQVPPLGYAIIRFYSSNPGYWMYHSTLDTQASRGMIGVFKVGEDHQIKEVAPVLPC